MHHSKLPLTAWFWAAYLMATHSNGIWLCNCSVNSLSAHKTAWPIRAVGKPR